MAKKKRKQKAGKGERRPAPAKRNPTRVRATPAPDPTRQDAIDSMTRIQAQIIAVCCDPANLKLTNREIIERVGCSITQYYRWLKDPDFQARRRQAMLDALRSSIQQVIGVALNTALEPGKEGHADRKMLLEMSGLYQPATKSQIELKAAPMAEGDMPDDELVYFYLACQLPRDRWIPGVRLRYEQGQIQPKKPADGSALSFSTGTPTDEVKHG